MDDLTKTLVIVLLALLLLGVAVLVAPELINRKQTATPPIGPTPPATESPGVAPPRAVQTTDVTLMIVIPEICIQQRVPDPAAETAVIREFILRNFRVVDQAQIARLRYNDQTLMAAHGDPEAIKALQALALQQYSADVLLLGEAFGEGPVPGAPSGFQSVRARVELRAIMTRTGQIIAAEGVHEGGVDLTFNTACKAALQRAGERMGKILVPQFEARFGLQSPAQERFEIIVTSLPFSLYTSLKSQVATLPSVRRVIADHYSDKQSQISVTYDGDPLDLVQQVAAIKLDGCRLEVLTYSSTRVSLKLSC